MRKKILKVIFQVLFILLFISVSSYALLTAYGYQVDLLKRNIVKTSIIDLANTINGVKVFYDNEPVAEKIPFQIKNVDPGEHEVMVIKDGYQTWRKKIDVELNVVTKISDILLLPENFDRYGKNFDIGFNYDSYISNKKWILFISNTENKIHAYKLNEDGSFLIDTINIKLDKASDFFFAGEDNISYQNSDILTLLNLSDKSIINITIPDEFRNFRVGLGSSLKGFYINDGNLYSADIDNEGAINEITLLSEEESFKSDKFDILNTNGGSFIISGGNLYSVHDKFLKIDKKVTIIPEVFGNEQEILYVKNNHEIIRNNINNPSGELIGRFAAYIDYLSWFDENRHLLLKKEGKLHVCDFSFDNCSVILNVSDNEDVVSGENPNQFVVISKDQIISYTYIHAD